MVKEEEKQNNNSVFKKVDFMGLELTYDEAKTILFPAPYSSTSLTQGTLDGPSEIIQNWNMEDYDLELNYAPCTAKIYPLPEKLYEGEKGLQEIHDITGQIIKDKKLPVVLGGDHAISISTVKAASESYNNLSVVIFDAHTDMKDSFDNKKNSNLSVAKRISETGVDIVQIGTRSVGSEELEDAEKMKAYCRVTEKEINQIVKDLNDNVYISIDVDAFDPSIMPATPMPEPWGLKWEEVIAPLKKIGNKKNIVGIDITELSPIHGFSTPNVICAQLAYKAIGIKYRRQAEEEGWENYYEKQIKEKKAVNR